MENSTKRNLYNLGGLVFRPLKKKKGDIIYKSVFSWVEAGKPDNVYIFDNVQTLLEARIPIVDSIAQNGIYTFIRGKGKLKPTKVRLKHLFEMKPIVIIKTVKGIHAADTKEHHKMSYK